MAEKDFQVWKDCAISRIVWTCILQGLNKDEIMKKCTEIQEKTQGISPAARMCTVHLEMAVSPIAKVDTAFFAGCNSNEERWKKIEDSRTPNKVTDADLVQKYGKSIGSFEELGETPEMRNMMDNRNRRPNNNNEARNLRDAFDAAKTPNSVLSDDTSEDCEAPVQQQRQPDDKAHILISKLFDTNKTLKQENKTLKQENKTLKQENKRLNMQLKRGHKRGRTCDNIDTVIEYDDADRRKFEDKMSELNETIERWQQKKSHGSSRAQQICATASRRLISL